MGKLSVLKKQAFAIASAIIAVRSVSSDNKNFCVQMGFGFGSVYETNGGDMLLLNVWLFIFNFYIFGSN